MWLSGGTMKLQMGRRLHIKKEEGRGGFSPGLFFLVGDMYVGDWWTPLAWLVFPPDGLLTLCPSMFVVHPWNAVAHEESLPQPPAVHNVWLFFPKRHCCPCPTLSLLCYEASALGASFRPFLRDGESEVLTVFRGGLTGSLASSCSDGSLYMATK